MKGDFQNLPFQKRGFSKFPFSNKGILKIPFLKKGILKIPFSKKGILNFTRVFWKSPEIVENTRGFWESPDHMNQTLVSFDSGNFFINCSEFFQTRRRRSNRGPLRPESDALLTELRPRWQIRPLIPTCSVTSQQGIIQPNRERLCYKNYLVIFANNCLATTA